MRLAAKLFLTLGFTLAGTAAWACTSPAGTTGDVKYVTNYNVMAYCDGTDWVAMLGTMGSGGGSATLLNELTDVSTGGASDGQALVFNSGSWGPASVQDSRIGTLTNNNWCTSDGSNINCNTAAPLTSASSINDLNDVDTSGAGAGSILAYSGGNWVVSTTTPGADDMGNHTASQTLNLNGNWLSGDGDAEGIFVDGSGNVGIGTINPEALLQIGSISNSLGTTAGNELNMLTLKAGTSNNDRLLFTTERHSNGTDWQTAVHRIQRKVDTTPMGYIQFGNHASDTITFGRNTTEHMRIASSSGNVGVGTSSPDAKLNVYGGHIHANGPTVGVIRVSEDDEPSEWWLVADGNDFSIGKNNTLPYHLVAHDNGNVGIGTNSPSHRLHVGGNIRIGGDKIFFNDDTTGDYLYYTTIDGITYFENGNQTWRLGAGDNFINGGNVGIGTSSPDTKLHVNGVTRSHGDIQLVEPSSGLTSSPDITFVDGDSNENGRIWADSGALRFRSASLAEAFRINANAGSEVIIVDGSHVGIGTNNPAAKLSVNGDIISTKGGGFYFGSNIYYDGVWKYAGSSDGGFIIRNDGAGIQFYTAPGNSSAGSPATVTERVKISENGNVGIGTSSPARKLHINSNGEVLRLEGAGGGHAFLTFYPQGGATRYGYFGYPTSGSDTLRMQNAQGQIVLSDSNGGCHPVAGTCTSDRRLKTNIQAAYNNPVLPHVSELEGKLFDWKDENKNQRQIGFIAQEVQKHFPELVAKGEDGYLTLDYRGLMVPLIKATAELNAKIQHLEEKQNAKIKALKAAKDAEINALKARIEALEAVLQR